jgi:basic membrane lipoprotein Med (substrate-binding protein (PBP1-ABC) superfamily)
VAREVKEGRFTPKVESFGLASGVIRLEVNERARGAVAESVWALVDAARDSIVALE